MTELQELIQRTRRNRGQQGTELISVLDENGCVLYISDSNVNKIGYSADELQGKCLFPLVHPVDLPTVHERFGFMVTKRCPTRADFRFAHKRGHWIDIRAEGNPLVDDEALRGFLIVSHTRITLNVEDVLKYLKSTPQDSYGLMRRARI